LTTTITTPGKDQFETLSKIADPELALC